MRTKLAGAFVVTTLLGFVALTVQADDNSWTNGSGQWETGSNWSLGVPPTNTQSAILITNAATKTVTIDATTSGSFPDTMTISNLTLSAPTDSTNTLFLSSAGTTVALHILQDVHVNRGGGLSVTDSAVLVGGSFTIDGSVAILSGLLSVTNNTTYIGSGDAGEVMVSNGIVLARDVSVGNSGHQGTLTVAGGAETISSSLAIGNCLGSSGAGGPQNQLCNFSLEFGLYGHQNYVTVAHSDGFYPQSGLTVECWLKPVGVWWEERFLGNYVGPNDGYILDINNGAVSFIMGTADGQKSIADTTDIGDGNWHHAAAVWDGTELHLYIDGVENVTPIPSGPPSVGSADFAMGAMPTGDYAFTGSLDELRVSAIARYSGNFTPAKSFTLDANTIAYWKLDEGAGTTAFDETVNHHDGTLVGDLLPEWMLDGSGNGPAVVIVSGGDLSVTNGPIYIGDIGNGAMIVSDGTLLANDVHVGLNSGSQGTLTIAGGTTSLSADLHLSWDGTVWVTAGQLLVTNGATSIGGGSGCQMTVSNGTVLANTVTVGAGDSTFTVAGGSATLFSDFYVGSDFGNAAVWVTGGQLAVTNGSTVIGSGFGGVLTVSNDAVLLRDVLLLGNGTLTVAGGTITLASDLNISGSGLAEVRDGQLVVTNGALNIGLHDLGRGTMTVSGGILLAGYAYIGFSTDAHDSQLTVSGGTATVSGISVVEDSAVWITGGQLACPNGIQLGDYWTGASMAVSNGTLLAGPVGVGRFGNLTVDGGTSTLSSDLGVGGLVWMTGGQLIVTNGLIDIEGGQVTVSNGTVLAGAVNLGISGGSQGTLTVSGGAGIISSELIIGDCGSGGSGIVTVDGGSLFITNATHDAFVDVSNGQLILNGGTLQIDRLVMTNACGLFVRGRGSLRVSSFVLDPNLSALGDGIPNGWKLQYGLDPFDPTVSGADPDGDGMSNLQEFLAGTDPNDPNSALRITAIAQEGDDVLVTWTMGDDKTNALQATSGDADGNFTNNFSDIFTVTNTVGGVTNYLDLGAATNPPARFYRVRLVP
jgi:hypothetical protein